MVVCRTIDVVVVSSGKSGRAKYWEYRTSMRVAKRQEQVCVSTPHQEQDRQKAFKSSGFNYKTLFFVLFVKIWKKSIRNFEDNVTGSKMRLIR